ncbi:interferon-induced very large GTPase 1-like [Nannospalax galili]|uniref:interferon-induced very large GTPase 1-like n=1 Tax=Nannospalax galili TaxID=1026970 RepID=UPI0004ED523C|nr:interferon-induced very large GTPase 1-like [Nannospalax galili]
MDTEEYNPDESHLRRKRRQDLQEMLTEVGLSAEYWLPKLQEHLGVTCAQALQYLKEKDLQRLKSQAQHPWEKEALEKLFEVSQANSAPELQDSSVDTIKKRQTAGEALQDLRGSQSDGKHRQEEALCGKETIVRQVMEVPEENLTLLEKPLSKVTETKQKQLSLTDQTLSHRKNLSDRDLIKQASGGLALQGIYKTSQQRDLIQRRDKLLRVPKELSIFGPEQGTRMESKEFTSSHAESIFTQTIEKLGFSITSSVKGGGWGIRLEAGMDERNYAESKDTHQSHSESSYFCLSKFNYIPLATCHFSIDQIQLSKAALEDLKIIDELLGEITNPDRVPLLRHRTERFFQRFGSHANQGPVHLGGIYCWKAIAEGFKSKQLAGVKQQASEALDIYIRGSYSGFGVKIGASMNMSDSHSKTTSQNTNTENLQTKVELSVAQTGGPPEAEGPDQWKAGLVASNQTWSVIDRGLQLVPIWDIILSNHRSDFKDPLQVANCLKDNYTALTGLSAQILEGEELLSAGKEVRLFLQDVKSWEVTDPEEQLQKLIHFMQTVSQKTESYDIWINTCLTDWDLQNFLVNTVNFCKELSIYKTHFIKSQLRSLLEPHVYKVKNFPHAQSIMKWMKESESEDKQIRITQFSELIENIEEIKNAYMEVSFRNDSPKAVEEAQRKATYELTTALSSFLNYLQETEQQDTRLLLLSFAAGSGYQVANEIFQRLLGHDELNFLLDEMQVAEKNYQELNNISKQRAQAFLVLTSLSATVGARANSAEEKTRRMALIRQCMGETLSMEVQHVLTKHGSHHDWETLEKDLRLILDGTFPLNDVMLSVLTILQENSEMHNKLYFLQWLSLFCENLATGHLEKLRENQRYLWSKVQVEKQKTQKSNSLTRWQSQIEAISTEINDCTLGIEQLLREVCQIYEALEESSSTRDSLFLCLPQIAADLMISGVPIELMDGDASYVPLKWVAAVFDKISEKLGDKQLFVLSVLGLQSSGKSTLLNALFGLQFTVSAGRCTRGAYMQLLKVEETFTKEFGFDFVLVVDTEGLRAPELSNKSQNRDNELATFVTGLGHLTLINIFGENPSEMQDILQIVVQAFLRMKQVKISPSCLFVHQNVGEVTAKDQNMEGRRKLEQRLDEMTALAAEQEECLHVTRFTDVIEFDVNTHVFYFAHLWDGNPPMAPPNPRYSHNVQELKSRILLTDRQESRRSVMKISDVKFRVQDLWKALVSENFIFSFKNTQEVMAMSKLETMYNQWSWKLRSHILDLQNQLNNQIQNGKFLKLTIDMLENPVNKTYETIKEEFEKYFQEDPESEILIQWKANFGNRLATLKDGLVTETRRKASELISLKKSHEVLDSQKKHYENELLEKSQKLALSVKGKDLSDENLLQKFNQLWRKWVYEVSLAAPPVIEPNIEVDSDSILWDYFNKERRSLSEKLTRNIEKFQINYDEHIKMRKNKFYITKSLETRHKESISKTTNNIFSRFGEIIKNIWIQQRDYDQNDFHEILRIIEKEVKSVSPEEDYTFTANYSVDLAVCLFKRASKSFKEIHEAFKRANDPVNYLESKKDDFFMSFKISCQGATSIKSFADFLWLKLIPAISASIGGKMVLKIAADMRATCPEFSGNRANLEKHILSFLAEEEKFDNYWEYIHNPESFFKSYIRNCIRRYCSENEGDKVKASMKMSLDDIKNAIRNAIYESTTVTPDKSSTASRWLDLFCDQLGKNMIFPRRDLTAIEHQEINDTEFLKEAMSAALDPAMKKVEEDSSGKPIEDMICEIEKILTGHLCGCWKQCPMCKAICTNTISTHDGDHSVPFHRPKAVNGWSWEKTNNFAIDCCSTSVASDNVMVLGDGRRIPFKNYRQAGGDYVTWSITPDLSTQPYWKWFVCHFRSKLEEKYQKIFANKGTIPHAWFKITKQDVLNDLKM